VYAVIFTSLVTWLAMTHLVQAAGGVFTVEVNAEQATYPSGSVVTYTIDYACNGADSSDTCDDVYMTVPRPAGASSNGTIQGSGQTVNHSFNGSTGRWQFIPIIPSGSTGRLIVSWTVPNYSTPNGTVVSATAEVRTGGYTGLIVAQDSGGTTISAEANYSTVKLPNTTTPISIGTNYTYTIGVHYTTGLPTPGRLGLDNLVYVDTLPPTATYVSSNNSGVYDPDTHTVTWPATTATSAGSAGSPVAPRTVTVRYDAANNAPGDSVTNTVDWTANGRGDTSDTQTGTASRTNLLTGDTVFGVSFSKTPDGSDYVAGSSQTWSMTLYNRSNVPVSGTLRDVLPCVDDTSAVLYTSENDPTASCANPSNRVTSVSVPAASTGTTISQIRWWSNGGASGSYAPAATPPASVTATTLGVPAGQWLTAIEYDYTIVENPTSPFSSTAAYFPLTLNGTLDPSLDNGDMVRNTASFTMSDGSNSTSGSDNGTITIANPIPYIQTTIVDAAGSGVVYQPTQQITWNATYLNTVSGGNRKEVRPDWYIAVPIGLRYIQGSVEFTNLPASIGQPEIIESYPGGTNLTGYTILHLRWPEGTGLPYGGLAATRQIDMRFKTLVEPSQLPGTYSGMPPSNAAAPTTASRSIYSAAYALGEPLLHFGSTDTYDYNENDITTESYRAASQTWRVALSASAFGDIMVQGSEDSTYGYLGKTQAGEEGDYRINLMNAGNDGSTLTDFVFYATLPHVGDGYVSQGYAGEQRGSDVGVTLTGPVTVPANVNVFYSLSTNPCRDEVYPNSSNPTCVDDWVSAAAITDWSQVKGLKFTMSGHYAEGEGELVTIPVRMDENAQRGDTAWMSIAYRARNVDNGITLLPAEAPRVGLRVIEESFRMDKQANPASGSVVAPGDTITYTLTAENNGDMLLEDVIVTDDASSVLSHASFVPGSFTVSGVSGAAQPILSGTTIRWEGRLAVGETVTITYQVRVNDDTAGVSLRNVLRAQAKVDGGTEISAGCRDTEVDYCDTTHHVPGFEIEKTSNPASGTEVTQGGTVTYTITVRNPTAAPLAEVRVTDDLSDVLKYARLNSGSLQATSSQSGSTPSTPIYADEVLRWTGALAANETVTLRYSVRVNDDAHKVTFRNAVIGVAEVEEGGQRRELPSSCTLGTETGCFTEHSTPERADNPAEVGAPDAGIGKIHSMIIVAVGLILIIAVGLVVGARRHRAL
jgi:fimbrial isopeptide formation D2 family protein/uncharacterized repeat protein (TIGR01451 family)